jgi:cytochrome c553
MNKLMLHELARLSNNSPVTGSVMETLNAKLDDQEIRDFRSWLRIMEQNMQTYKNRKPWKRQ